MSIADRDLRARRQQRRLRRPATGTPPLLRTGDHLSRDEFERRYAAMPQVKKAELLEGVVYMPSPATVHHAEPDATISMFASLYAAHVPGIKAAANATVRLGSRTEVQPDVLLRKVKDGSSSVGADGYIKGAPELVIEVAYSSVSVDLHEKRRLYRRAGVQEYIVWRIEDGAIDWWELKDGEFVPLVAGEDGVLRSRAFPGFWLDPGAILGGDYARALETLQAGISARRGS